MIEEEIYPGTCIVLPKPGEQIGHLWIVLTEPEDDPPHVVIVNLTSRRDGSDTTVVLQSGEHPFLNRETVVNYQDARIVEAEPILQLVLTMPGYEFQDDMNEDLLTRIQQGLLQSEFTPNKIKTYCRDRFDLE